jgi:signal transduction histidine kinase
VKRRADKTLILKKPHSPYNDSIMATSSPTAPMPFIKQLRQLWLNFATSGIKFPVGSIERSRTMFINIFSLIGFTVELCFGLLNLTNGYYGAGGIETAAAVVMLANFFLLRRHRNVYRAARILLIVVAAPLMTMLLTASAYNTGVFWLPAFPVAAYLILGKRQGSTALFILFITIGTMTLLESFQLVQLAYSFLSIRQMIISLLLLTALLYVHENLREQSIQQADERALAFRAAYKKVRQTEQARDEYTLTLAHELHNSLVAIQKLAETWRDQHQSMTPERSLEYMNLIHESATDNLATINSLRDIVNVDRATFTVDKRLHSLREIIDQQIRLFEPQAKKAQLKLDRVFDDELPWQLSIDSFRMKEVLTNLLTNAMKHTAPGHTITVQAIKAADHEHLQQRARELGLTWYLGKHEPKLQAAKDFVFLGVSHQEVGISQQDIGKLFKKFSRLQPSDQLHPPKGHGLGLYIIRRITESHGGTYGVASQVGQGVTFYVTLPIEKYKPDKTIT